MEQPPYGFIVGNKWFSTCGHCGQVVRVDKPLIGSLHFCLTDDEIAAQATSQQRGADRGLWESLGGIGAGLGPLPENVTRSASRGNTANNPPA